MGFKLWGGNGLRDSAAGNTEVELDWPLSFLLVTSAAHTSGLRQAPLPPLLESLTANLGHVYSLSVACPRSTVCNAYLVPPTIPSFPLRLSSDSGDLFDLVSHHFASTKTRKRPGMRWVLNKYLFNECIFWCDLKQRKKSWHKPKYWWLWEQNN